MSRQQQDAKEQQLVFIEAPIWDEIHPCMLDENFEQDYETMSCQQLAELENGTSRND